MGTVFTIFALLFNLLEAVDEIFCDNLPGCRPLTASPTIAPSLRPTFTPDGNFTVKLVNMGNISEFDHLFGFAAERWQRVIVNDLPTVGIDSFPEGDIFNGAFSRPLLEVVDDVTIGYEIGVLPGGILGRAGPIHIRQRSGTTITGIMQFSANFFSRGSDADNLMIILHEMGHVLGIGGRWDNVGCDSGCTAGEENFLYTCRGALQQYQKLNLNPPLGTGLTLRVSDQGGRGTRCGHWGDESFNSPIWSEVMTPFFNPRKLQLITVVSLGSLTDIGDYEVDFNAADPIPTSFIPSSELLEYGFFPDNEIDLTLDPIEDTEPIFLDA